MKLHILSSELKRLQTHACEGYPHEVVGILAGSRQNHRITKVQPLVNERADTHNRYKVSGLLLMRAEQKLESEGLKSWAITIPTPIIPLNILNTIRIMHYRT